MLRCFWRPLAIVAVGKELLITWGQDDRISPVDMTELLQALCDDRAAGSMGECLPAPSCPGPMRMPDGTRAPGRTPTTLWSEYGYDRTGGNVARIAEVRPPASPASKNQVARRKRILAVAAELGAEVAYERVQMQEVAKASDVALGTLYRYFPSKVHLFAELWRTHIDGFIEEYWSAPGSDPVATVGDHLVALTRSLLDRPLLSSAMVQATAVDYAVNPDYHFRYAEDRLCRAVLHTLGRETPSHDEICAVRLLAYSWWGVLISALHRNAPEAQGEEELRLAARLLLTTQ